MLASLVLAAAFAAAQDPAAVKPEQPAADLPKAEAPAAAPAAPEAPKAAEAAKPAEAPKVEENKAKEAAAEPKPEPKAEPKKVDAALKGSPAGENVRGTPEQELAFLKERAKSADGDALKAAAEELELFVEAHPDAAFAPEALGALADAQSRRGDKTCLVTWLSLIYEFPESAEAGKGRAAFNEAANKMLPRKLREQIPALGKAPEGATAADRLAALQAALAGLGDALTDPALEQNERFERRFPAYAGGDRVGLSEGWLQESKSAWQAALLAYDRVLALWPASPARPDTLWSKGNLLADHVKDHRSAAATFLELAEKYQESAKAPDALERAAQLLTDKLKQWSPAVDAYRKLVQRYPGTEAARRSLQAEAKLERSRLGNPEQAAKTLEQLAEMFPRHPEAPEALYEASEIYEDDLKDNARAVAEYKLVASKFPDHKLGKKAADRAAKLGAK